MSVFVFMRQHVCALFLLTKSLSVMLHAARDFVYMPPHNKIPVSKYISEPKKNDNQQQKVDLVAICARPTLKMFVFLRLFRKHFQRFNRERFVCFKIINVSTVPSFFFCTLST